MVQELVYTSAEKGLIAGTRGFATVAMTEGLSLQARQLLESLSGYTHIYTGHNADYVKNPIVWSHLISSQGDSILSRVAAYDFDYTGRTNKLAHHWLFAGERQFPACGPAEVMQSPNVFATDWHHQPMTLKKDRLQLQSFMNLPEPSARAVAWGATRVGEKGAAALAQYFKNSKNGTSCQPAYIIFDPEDQQTDLLALVSEASALLDPVERWKVTFSTYFTAIPIGMRCDWRFCLREDPTFLRQRDRSMWIDLASGAINNASFEFSYLANIATTGLRPVAAGRNPNVGQPVVDILVGGSTASTQGRSQLKLKEVNKRSNSPASMRRNLNESVSKPEQQDHSLGVLKVVALIVVSVLGLLAFYKYDKKDASKKAATTEENKTINPDLTKSVPDLITNQSENSVSIKTGTSTLPEVADQVAVTKTNNISNTESQVKVEKQTPPPTIKDSTEKEVPPVVYKYAIIKKLTADTVPDMVDEKIAVKEVWHYSAIKVKDNASGKRSKVDGAYRPKYQISKGPVEAIFKTDRGEGDTLKSYNLILFDKEGCPTKYLYVNEQGDFKINPPVVYYPETCFKITEFEDVPQGIVTAFNETKYYQFRLYIMDKMGRSHFIKSPDCKIIGSKVSAGYSEELIGAIKGEAEKFRKVLDCKEYVDYLQKIAKKKTELSGKEEELKRFEKQLNDDGEAKNNGKKQESKSHKISKEKRESLEKGIARLKGEKDPKGKKGEIEEIKEQIEKLIAEEPEQRKSLERKIQIQLTIQPPDLK